MNPTRLFIPAAAVVILLSACSKDKKLERLLFKQEGAWNISSVTWTRVQQDTSGQLVKMGTTADAGTFAFEKDGDGSYDFTVDGVQYTTTFDWTVSDGKIAVTKISQSFFGSIGQVAVAFSGTQTDSKTITLEGSETTQYVGGSVSQSVISGTFVLVKQ